MDKAQKGKGILLATKILECGDAYKKLVEIIKAQGKKCINPDKINVGEYIYDYKAQKTGKIMSITNSYISKVARIAGAPEDIGAGIYLHNHVGDEVRKGEVIFSIFAHNKKELDFAIQESLRSGGIIIK